MNSFPVAARKVIRLGESAAQRSAERSGAVCPPPSPLGVSPSHLCSDRMYVCGDYKLIVHGGPRGENHITERRRDYRLLNAEDYTFRPPLLGLATCK